MLNGLKERAIFLLRRRGNYRATFTTDAGRAVLVDLRRFTKHGESPLVVSPATQVTDAMATGVRIGRQEVMQRILAHMRLTDEDLQKYLKDDDQ